MNRGSAAACNLCDGLSHIVDRAEFWTLALNANQNLPGRSVLVLNYLFAPDLYNLAFLMNSDAHVHLHIVPRYASPVDWRGETYTDPHYGSLFGKEQRPASEEALEGLAGALGSRL